MSVGTEKIRSTLEFSRNYFSRIFHEIRILASFLHALHAYFHVINLPSCHIERELFRFYSFFKFYEISSESLTLSLSDYNKTKVQPAQNWVLQT